jgi:hypothetical protein
MDIEQAIKEKRRQIEKLEQEISTLERASHILGQTISGEKNLTQPAMVEAILANVGKPMHVDRLIEQIKIRYKRNVKKNNLGVTLYRYADRGSKFYKVPGKPNTYALLAWQKPGEKIRETQEPEDLKAAS